MRDPRNTAQWFCLAFGAVLLAEGAVGLAIDPDFATPGNGWHQLIHVLSGAVLLLASRGPRPAIAVSIAVGVAYAAVVIPGLAGAGDSYGVIPVGPAENVLHSLLALTSLAAGLASLALARPSRPALAGD